MYTLSTEPMLDGEEHISQEVLEAVVHHILGNGGVTLLVLADTFQNVISPRGQLLALAIILYSFSSTLLSPPPPLPPPSVYFLATTTAPYSSKFPMG